MPLLSSRLQRFASIGYLILIFLLAVLINLVSWARVEEILAAIPYACPLKKLTHLSCAFCGMTHSWLSFLRGDWAESFRFNFLGPSLLVGSIAVAIQGTRGQALALLQRREFWWVIITILFVYAIARNLF